MLGWRLTKSPIAPAKTSMTPTAITIAITMTTTCWAMPTAVITESSENTMSSTRICTSTTPNVRPCRPLTVLLVVRHLELVVDLVRRLGDEEQPAAEQDQVASRECRGRTA